MFLPLCSRQTDDEEITSESDADSEGDGDQHKKEEQHRAPKRKLKMADYPDFLAKRHQCFEQYRY